VVVGVVTFLEAAVQVDTAQTLLLALLQVAHQMALAVVVL
jgi:hypothetical protein